MMIAVRNSSTFLRTGEKRELQWTDPLAEIEYPSRWFDVHNHSRPPVSIPTCREGPESLYNAVRGGIQTSSLTLSTVKVFLVHYAGIMKTTLPTNWTSYGVILGEEGKDLTPMSLLEVKEAAQHVPRETPVLAPTASAVVGKDHPSTWEPKALALYIFCVYRLSRVQNKDYLESLARRMTEVLGVEGGAGMSLEGTQGIYSGWASDPDFLKLVSAYDMFLHRFKDHPASILRLGTLGSRFKDCAGLLSVGYAMRILGIGAGELMDWIFIAPMGDEMVNMTKEGEESGDQYSYFPYQSEMGLVGRSAYSSNANPYLFTWIHIIGTLLGHRRSQNARFFFEGNLADIGLNAVLVAWAHSRGGELRPQFSGDGVDYSAGLMIDGGEGRTAGDEDDGPPASEWVQTAGRAPGTWFALAFTRNFSPPKVVRAAIKHQTSRIGETRENSIGEYVRERFLY